MNIVHQKRELSLVKLEHIDFLLNKYEGQFMAEDIKKENKMMHRAKVSELNHLIDEECHKTKEDEQTRNRDKTTRRLNNIYGDFIKALEKKRSKINKEEQKTD